MKKKIASLLMALCSTFAVVGFASCDLQELFPDSSMNPDTGLYSMELETEGFNPMLPYGEKFDCTGLMLHYKQELRGEIIWETKIQVSPDMFLTEQDMSVVGEKEVVIAYENYQFTLEYEVRYRVEYMVGGEVFNTQYVYDVSEVQVPDAPEREGYAFQYWKTELPEVLTGNLKIEAQYYNTTITVPSLADLETEYDPDATLGDLTLPQNSAGKWVFVDNANTPIGNVGTYELAVRFVPTTDEFPPVADDKITLVVKQKEVIFTVEERDYEYNGAPQFPAYTVSEDVEVVSSLEAQTNAGTYSYTLTLKDPNYTGSYAGTFTIAQKLVTFDVAIQDYIYDGQPHFPSYEVSVEGVEVVSSLEPQINAGTYSFTLSIPDENYVGSYSDYFTIGQKYVEITTGNNQFTYNGQPQFPDITLSEEIELVGKEAQVNAGTYSYTLTPASPNYDGICTGSFTIAQKQITFTAEEDEFVYDGEVHQPEITIEGGVEGEEIETSTTLQGKKDVGEYSYIITVTDPNYTGIYRGTFTIKTLVVTITLHNFEILYGDELPTFTYDITTEDGTEYPKEKWGILGIETTRILVPNVGEYTISATVNDPNVQATVEDGKLVIMKADSSPERPSLSSDTLETAPMYGDKLGTVTFGEALGTWVWENPDLIIDQMEGFEAWAFFTPMNSNLNPTKVKFTLQQVKKRVLNIEVLQNRYTYDQQPHTIVYQIVDSKIEGIVYDNDTITVNDQVTETNAGTYKTTLTIDNACYEGSVDTALFIDKATPTITISIEDWVFGGVASEPAYVTNNTDSNLSVSYTYSTTNGARPYNAGEYTVYAVLKETANYVSVTSESVTFTIAKADNTDDVMQAQNATYGDLVNDRLTLPTSSIGKWSWKDVTETTTVGNAGTQEFYAVFTPSTQNAGNYNEREVKVTVTVAKKAITAPTILDKTYTGEGLLAETTDTNQALYTIKQDGWVNAGTHTVTIVLNDADNYAWSENDVAGTTTVSMLVRKATAQIENLVMENWTYGGTASEPTATSNFGTVRFVYLQNGNEIVKPVNYGFYMVKAIVDGTDNWTGTEITKDFAIEQATNSLTVTLEGWVYGENAKEPIVTSKFGNKEDATFLYKPLNGTEFVEQIPTAAGTYIVMAKIAATTNYSACSNTAEFVISKATPTITVSLLGWVYGGTANTPGYSTNNQDAGQEVSYTYSVDNVTFTDVVPTSVGIYYVKATIAETDNYLSASSEALPFAISQTGNTITVSMEGWTYGENAKQPTVVADFGQDTAVVTYFVHNVWTTEQPTEAGTYAVKATIAGTDDYNGCEGTAIFTIAKADNNVDVVEETQSAVYGGLVWNVLTLPTSNLGEWSWKNVYEWTTVGTVGEHSFVAKFTPNAAHSNNYNEREVTVTVTVTKQTITVPTLQTKTYTGSPLTAELTAGTPNGLYTIEQQGWTTVNTYPVKLTLTDGDNYCWSSNYWAQEVTVYFTIEKALSNTMTLTMEGWTYGEDANAPETTEATFGKETVVYTYYQDGTLISAPTDAGTYTVVATIADTTNYVGCTASKQFMIAKRVVEVPTIVSATYTGSALTAVVTDNTDEDLYAITQEGWTEAGTYDVTLTLLDANNYVWSEGDTNGVTQVAFVVEKATVVITDLTMEGWTYGEDEVLPTAQSNFGTIVYTYWVNSVWTDVQPTDVGNYQVKASVATTDNWIGDEETKTFTITQASNEITSLSIHDWTYKQTANQPTANALFGTIVYTYAVKNSNIYTQEVPTNAGVYTLKASVVGTTNYTSCEKTVDFEIAKADNTENVYQMQYATYGDLISTLTLPDSTLGAWSWQETQTTVGTAGTHIFTAQFVPTDSANYNARAVEVTVYVAKQEVALPSYSAPTLFYTGSAQTVEVATSTLYTIAGNSGEDAGTYTITLTLTDADNYTWENTTDASVALGNFVIAQANNQLTLTMAGWTYHPANEGASNPTITATFGAETVVYTYAKLGGSYTTVKPTTAGTYTVKATIAATNNYKACEATQQFVIEKATPTLTVSIEGWTYANNANTPTYATNNTDYEVGEHLVNYVYADAIDGEYNATVPSNAGTYFVKAIMQATDNYLTATSEAVSFTIAKKAVAVPTIANATYTGNALQAVATNNVDGTLYTITQENWVNAGTYAVTLTLNTPANYVWANGAENTTEVQFQVEKAQAEITNLSISGWTHGGTASVPTATSNFGNVVYSYLVNGAWTQTQPTDAGTYTVQASVAESENWLEAVVVTEEFTIAQAQNSIESLTIAGWTYAPDNVNANTPQLQATFGADTVVYTYYQGGTALAGIPVNAGSYTVVATIAETGNYTGAQESATFEIAKATATLTIALNGWTYGQAPNMPSYETSNTDGDEDITYAYSATPVNAGTYTVSATIPETANYLSATSNVVTFTIAKAIYTPNAPQVTTANITYEDTLSMVTLADNNQAYGQWIWKNETLPVGDAGWQKHTAKFVFDEDVADNYQPCAEQLVELRVNKKSLTIEADLADNTYTYDGFAHTLSYTITDGVQTYDNITVIGNTSYTMVGSYIINLTIYEDNYVGSGSYTLCINKANLSAEELTIAPLSATYEDTLGKFALPETEKGTWSWKLGNATSVGNVGTNVFVATFKGNSNYNDAEVEVSIQVSAKQLYFVAEAEQRFVYVKGTQYALSYFLEDSEGKKYTTLSVNNAEKEEVGEYQITISLNAGNYTANAITCTLIIEQASYAVTLPTGLTAVYGDKLGTVILPTDEKGVWVWEDTELPVGNAGNNAFTATFTPNDTNYAAANYKVNVTVAKAKVAIPAAIASKMYTGERLQADVASDAYYDVFMNDGGTVVGNYNVIFALRDSANRQWADLTEADQLAGVKVNGGYLTRIFSITKATASISSLTLQGWTYGEIPNAPQANVNFGSVVYSYYDNNGQLVSNIANANAGTYTVQANVAGSQNWNEATPVTKQFTISKASVTPTLSESTAVYTGNEINVTVLINGLTYGTDFTYSVANQARTAVQIIHADTYAITVSLTEKGAVNYQLANDTLAFTVTKATPNVTVSLDGWTYGQQANTPELTTTNKDLGYTITYVYSTSDGLQPRNAGKYTVRATISETANYLSATSNEESFTIAKAQVMPTLTTNSTVYTGEDISVDVLIYGLTKDEDYTYTPITVINAGTYPVQVSLTESASKNYSLLVSTLTFTVTKATPIITSISMSGWEYGKYDATRNAPQATANIDGAQFAYKYYDSNNNEVQATQLGALSAGICRVEAYVIESSNYYQSARQSASFMITKVKVETPAIASKEYTGETQTSGFVVDSNAPYILVAGSDVGGVHKGTYSVIFELKDYNNYEWIKSTALDYPNTVILTLTRATVEYKIIAQHNVWLTGKEPAITTEWYYGQTGTVTMPEARFGDTVDVFYVGTTNAGVVYSSAQMPDQAGNYTVTFSVAESEDWGSLSTTLPFTIKKQVVTVPGLTGANNLVYEYNTTKTIGVATSTLYTINYNGEESLDGQLQATDAGAYSVALTLTDKYNYIWSDDAVETTTLSFSIAKATATLTVSIEGWIYDLNNANQKAPTYTTNNTDFANGAHSVTYKYSASEDGEYSSTVPVNANTYYVKAWMDETANYKAAESAPFQFTIAKKEITVPTIKSAVYTGSALTAVPTNNADSALYTITQEGWINAGTHTVTLELNDPDNYEWSSNDNNGTTTAEFFVDKATTTITDVHLAGWVYGSAANTPTYTTNNTDSLVGKVTYWYATEANGTYTTTVPTDADTYYLKVTIAQTANFKEATSTPISFVISKQQVEAPTIASKEYTGETLAADITITADTLYTVSQNNGGIQAGNYDVILSLKNSDNYEWKTNDVNGKTTLTFTITQAKKDNFNISLTAYDWMYGEATKLPTISWDLKPALATLLTLQETQGKAYYLYYDSNQTLIGDAPTTQGTYYVQLVVNACSNYEGTTTGLYEFKITERQASVVATLDGETLTASNITKTYKNGVFVWNETVTGVNNQTLTKGTDYTVAITCNGTNATMQDVATYLVTLTMENKNYTWTNGSTTLSYTITVEQATAEITNLAITGWTYGDTANAPSANTNFGTITYTYFVDGEWTETAPDQAGTYTVKASVAGSDNWTEADDKETTFTIAKKEVTPSVTVDGKVYTSTFTYNTEERAVAVAIVGVNGNLTASDFTYTVSPATVQDAGTYTVTVELTNDNYSLTQSTFTFTIDKAKVTKPTLTTTEYTYKGSAYTVMTAQTGYTLTGNTATNVGDYTVTATLEENYTWNDGSEDDLSFDYAITPMQLSAPTITAENNDVYDGTVKFNVENAPQNAPYTVTVSEGRINVGTYTASVTFKAGELATNYAWIGVDKWTKDEDANTLSYSYTIEQATAKATLKTSTVVYDGQAHEIVVIVTDISNGNQVLTTGFTITGNETKKTDKADYSVTVELTDTNYKWSDSTTTTTQLTFSITQATNVWNTDPSITGWTFDKDNATASTPNMGAAAFGAATVHYTGRLNDGTAYNSTTIPSKAGAYTATFTVAGNDNYTGLTKEINFTIAKQKVTKPTIASKPYTGAPQTAVVEASDLYETTTNEGGEIVGSYDVVLTLTDANNYEWSDSATETTTCQFAITKAANEWTTDLSMEGWTIDETEKSPNAVAKFGTVIYTYYTKDGIELNEKPEDAGEYAVSAQVEGTDNYDGLPETAKEEFTIAEASVIAPTLTWTGNQTEYTTAAQFPVDLTSTGDGKYTIKVEYKAEGATTFVTWTDTEHTPVGTYRVSVTLNTPENYKWTSVDTNWAVNGEVLAHTYEIYRQDLIVPTFTANNTVYTGETIPVTMAGQTQSLYYVVVKYEYAGESQTWDSATENNLTNIKEVGTYTLTAVVADPVNYMWTGVNASEKVLGTIEVTQREIDVPTLDLSFAYTGETQKPTLQSEALYTIAYDNADSTDVGTYTATVTLRDSKNNKWKASTGNSTSLSGETATYTYKITAVTATATVTLDGTALTAGTTATETFVYKDGTPFALAVTIDGITVGGSDYTISIVNENDTPIDKDAIKVVGTYTVTITLNNTNYTLSYNTYTFEITKKAVNAPTIVKDTDTDYTGNAKYTITTIAGQPYTVTGDTSATNVGTYDVSVALTDTANYEWGTTTGWTKNNGVLEFSYEITPQKVDKPSWAGESTFTYDGEEKTVTLANYDEEIMDKVGELTATNAYTYEVVISLEDTTNYVWADETTAPITLTFTINAKEITVPTLDKTSLTVYSGSAQTVTTTTDPAYTITCDNGATVEGGTITATNAGTYNVTFTLNNPDGFTNYVWADSNNSATAKTESFVISKAKVTAPIPSLEKTTYTGSTIAINGLDSTSTEYGYTITKDGETVDEIKDAGEYTVTVTLKDAANYQWIDGTVVEKTTTLNVAKQNVINLSVTMEGWTYGEDAKEPVLTWNLNGTPTASTTTYYKVEGSTATKLDAKPTAAGTYYVEVMVADTPNHGADTATSANFTIEQKAIALPNLEIVETDTTYSGNVKFSTTAVTCADYTVTTTGDRTSVGEHTITITLEDTVNTKWAITEDTNWGVDEEGNLTYSMTITPLEVTLPALSATSFQYNGSAQKPTVVNDDKYTVAYTTSDSTAVGNYTLTVTLNNANYAWPDMNNVGADINGLVATYSYTITKAQVTASAELAGAVEGAYTYSGNEFALTVTVKDGETELTKGEEYTYKINGETTTEIKNAGTYTVTVSMTDTNYQLTGDTEFIFTVNKYRVEVPAELQSLGKGDALPERFTSEYFNAKAVHDETGAEEVAETFGSHTLTLTLKDTNNCIWADGTSAPIGDPYQVVEGYIDLYAIVPDSATYTGNEIGLKMNGVALADDTYYTVTISGEVKEQGTYTITLTKTDAAASRSWMVRDSSSSDWTINEQTAMYTVTIGQATNVWNTAPSITGWTFDKDNATASTPNMGEAKFGAATVNYTGTQNDGTAYNSTTQPTQAGSYKAIFTVEGTKNYKVLTKEIEFTIAKAADIEVEIKQGYNSTQTEFTFTYDNQDHMPIVDNDDYNITVKKDGKSFDGIVIKDFGVYTITLTLSDANNHDWADGTSAAKQYTVTINQAQVYIEHGFAEKYYQWDWESAWPTNSVNTDKIKAKTDYQDIIEGATFEYSIVRDEAGILLVQVTCSGIDTTNYEVEESYILSNVVITPVAYIGDTKYGSIEDAVDAGNQKAVDGAVSIYVIPNLDAGINVTSDITLESNVILTVPFEGIKYDIEHKSESNSEIESLATSYADSSQSNINKYRKTLINMMNGADIVIESGAELLLGGQFREKGITGYYCEINLDEGSAIVCSGRFVCNGYVKENAKTAKNSGQDDYKTYSDNSFDEGRWIQIKSGGYLETALGIYKIPSVGNLTVLNNYDIFPFSIFDFPNLQTYVSIEYGAEFNSKIHMRATTSIMSYNINESVSVVRPDTNAKALFYMNSGSMDLEYCPENVTTASENGLTKIYINGEITLGSISLTVAEVNTGTEGKFLPIHYKFDIVIKEGATFTAAEKVKFLPGSKLKVEAGGTVYVNNALIFYEASASSSILGYPTDKEDAIFINNGSIIVGSKGSIGAFIETEAFDDSASIDFSQCGDSTAFTVTSNEGLENVSINRTSEGYFEDGAEIIIGQFVAGSKITSSTSGNKCWTGEKYVTRSLDIVVEDKGYTHNIYSYQIFVADNASGSNSSEMTSGVTQAEGSYAIADGKYVKIAASRYASAVLNDQTLDPNKWYPVSSNMALVIIPNQGVAITIKEASNSGSSGTTWTIQESSTKSGTYYEVGSSTGNLGGTFYIVQNWYFKVSYSDGLGSTVIDKGKIAAGPNAGSEFKKNTAYQATEAYTIEFTRKSCIAAGTLITLADGSQKKVEDLALTDIILSYNFETGTYQPTMIAEITNHGKQEYTVTTLKFNDNSSIDIIANHGFFDITLKKFVDIDSNNYQEFIGHKFMKYDNGVSEEVILVSGSVNVEENTAYSLTACVTINAIANNLVTITPPMTNWYNMFEVTDDLIWDQEQKQADIEKYGLFTYEEVSALIPYDVYFASNFQYFKVAMGKGLVTMEEIEEFIEWYLDLIEKGEIDPGIDTTKPTE